MTHPAHVQGRLQVRDLSYTTKQLEKIATRYPEDTAVILGQVPSLEGLGYEKIILIVRNRKAQTIMRRRTTQTFSPKSLKVRRIVYHEL